jgi:hypothetical protein
MRIRRFRKRLGGRIARIALVRIVAAEFPQQRDDLRRLPLGKDGDLERQLVASIGELILVALRDEDHRREEQVEDRGDRCQNGKRKRSQAAIAMAITASVRGRLTAAVAVVTNRCSAPASR